MDPRSGEILDSDIIFTNGWVKHWISQIETTDGSKDPLGLLKDMLDELMPYAGESGDGSNHHHDHHHHHHEGEGDSQAMGWSTKKRSPEGMKRSLRHHRAGICQEARTKFDMSPRLVQMALEARQGSLVSEEEEEEG